MIVSQKLTGRDWGQKLAPKAFNRRIDGEDVRFEEFDHWDGPVQPGDRGQFIRATRIVDPLNVTESQLAQIEFGPFEWPR